MGIPVFLRVPLVAASLCSYSSIAWGAVDSVKAGAVPTASDSVEWIAFVAPNGENETYLRYLQIAGAVPRYPWGLRGFSPRETKRLAARVGTHPWSRSASFNAVEKRMRTLPFVAELRANSAFPYGSNDGPVWAGRGLTLSGTAGLAFGSGPISLVLAPTAFMAQNAEFDLLDNGHADDRRFADGHFPENVDRPQRFGDKAYGRIDPGNSTLRADVGPVAAGISTANMAWGPFELYPFTLGTNAPGFLHGFLGTSRPVNLWIGSLHARVIWGRLEQSAYSPVQGSATYVTPSNPGTRRFASGLLAVFEPRGMRGLELGLSRFFHSPWLSSGVPFSYYKKPFEDILKQGLKGSPEFVDAATSDNQLISAFGRWAFPTIGFEMYAEYGREDHSWDKRDLLQEPDHSRSYGLGMRKSFRLGPERLEGLTFELINFEIPHLLRTLRGEGSVYAHVVMRQGHTNRGQLLGSDVGVGAAAGSTIRWDRYSRAGRTSIALHRVLRQDRGDYYMTGLEDPESSDVQYALELNRRRRMRGLDVTTRASLIHELNRDFKGDVTGVSVAVAIAFPSYTRPWRRGDR